MGVTDEQTGASAPEGGPEPTAILELRDVARAYGHVEALRGVSLTLRRGEILGIVGDNGAGKSTLMKIVAGAVQPDRGEIHVAGVKCDIRDTETARKLGIEMIYQHLALFDNLDVASNIFIGREPLRLWRGPLGFVDRRRTHREAAALLKRLGISLSSTKLLVEGLSGGQRQMVAIARAVAFEEHEQILIMDEPSAALGTSESATVLELIRTLRERGLSILVISHRIPEVLELADRVAVLKRGELVAVVDAGTCTVEQCVNLIVAGRAALDDDAEAPAVPRG